AIGRTILPEDCSVPGRQPVIVLSYQSWQHRFSSDPSIIGKTVLLHGYPFEIVGVASAGFAGLGSRPSEFWVPLTMAPRFEPLPDLFSSSQSRSLSIVARLKPKSAERQAQAGLTVWMQRLTAADPNPEKALRAQLLSRATTKPLSVRTALTFS